jgi:DNA-binding response OmpR family regulator
MELRSCMHTTPQILVVEDNVLYAEVVSDFVVGHGFEVAGPVSTLEKGLEYAQSAELDGAILDINLNGRYCFPICAALAARHIPFVFLTAYDRSTIIPREFRSTPLLSKPFNPNAMNDELEKMVRGDSEDETAADLSCSLKSATQHK